MKKDLYEKNLHSVRLGITPLLVICILAYFLIKLLLSKLVSIPNDNIIYASLFISIGLFFLLLDITNRLSVKLTKKNSIKTNAEIVKCEKHTKRDSKGVIEAQYYIIDYLINYNGEEVIAQRLAENKRKVGKVDQIYYNTKNNIVFLSKEIDEDENGIVFYILAGIFFLIALPIIVFPLIGGVLSNENFWISIFGIVVGIGSIIGGIMLFKEVFKDYKKEKEYEKIEATIIGNIEGSYHNRDKNRMVQTFYPIYEYTYNGIKKTYECPHNGFLEVGSKQTIMISKITGDIHTKTKKSGKIFGAIFCLLIGLVSTIACIMSFIVK